ncbi:MAG: hypothetical protein IIY78_07930 [Clostridia bacterium]|nr:hypothetical protein [Clostridia bacterium]
MGNLVIHQKVKAGLEEYEVKVNNVVKYKVKKKLIAAGADFDIFDAVGNKVGLVDQKVLNMVKTFDITLNGQKFGTVKKEFPALTKDMKYDYKGWKLDGDLLGMNFKFTNASNSVMATVQKKVVAFGDTYEVAFTDAQDELLMVALTVILDEAFHSKRS